MAVCFGCLPSDVGQRTFAISKEIFGLLLQYRIIFPIMKIILPGGTGQVGSILARHFHELGHDVVVLSRMTSNTLGRVVPWDGISLGDWVHEIDGADVVINLAGRSVNCRYTSENRRQILESRIKSTHAVGQAIAAAKQPPKLWLQSSTATIYAHRYDAANDEITGIIGGNEPNAPDTWRFSIDVAQAWEQAARQFQMPRTRQVLLRSAMVMSPDKGGVFDTLLDLTRKGLGGQAGSGRQYVSWIHEQDFVRAIEWLIEHHDLNGPVNLAAPNPLPNVAFMAALRQAAHIPFGLPTATWMLELGAWFMRTETELLLKSRRVVPSRLLQWLAA